MTQPEDGGALNNDAESAADWRSLAECLRHLREHAGIKVSDAAEKLGVQRNTAYSWEIPEGKGSRRPEPEVLGKLLDLYSATDRERLEAWRLRSLPREKPEDDADLPPEAGEPVADPTT